MSTLTYRGKKFRHRGHQGVTTKAILKAMDAATQATMAWYRMVPAREGAAFDMIRRLVLAIGDANSFDQIPTEAFPHVLAGLQEVTRMHNEPWPTDQTDPVCVEFKHLMNSYQRHTSASDYCHLVNTLFDNPRLATEQDLKGHRFEAINTPLTIVAMKHRLIYVYNIEPDELNEDDKPEPPSAELRELVATSAKFNVRFGAAKLRKVLQASAGVNIASECPEEKIADALAAISEPLADAEQSEALKTAFENLETASNGRALEIVRQIVPKASDLSDMSKEQRAEVTRHMTAATRQIERRAAETEFG